MEAHDDRPDRPTPDRAKVTRLPAGRTPAPRTPPHPSEPNPTSNPTKFTATDAALEALMLPGPRATVSRNRIVGRATVLWCRGLQFPSIRRIGRAAGISSPSSVSTPFGTALGIQAEVIRREWSWVERWLRIAPDGRDDALAAHGHDLTDRDPVCLRLPGLVCSAVVGSGVLRARPPAHLLAPLHALAALVDIPGNGSDPLTAVPWLSTLASAPIDGQVRGLSA